jgi:hypothetical protein
MRPALSELSTQPLPTFGVAVAPVLLNVGAGSVGTAPVGVYVGSKVTTPPPTTPLIEAGGQEYIEETDAGI